MRTPLPRHRRRLVPLGRRARRGRRRPHELRRDPRPPGPRVVERHYAARTRSTFKYLGTNHVDRTPTATSSATAPTTRTSTTSRTWMELSRNLPPAIDRQPTASPGPADPGHARGTPRAASTVQPVPPPRTPKSRTCARPTSRSAPYVWAPFDDSSELLRRPSTSPSRNSLSLTTRARQDVRALVVKQSAARGRCGSVCPVRFCRGPALAVLGAVALAWLGLLGFVFTDYEVEAAPAFAALTHGSYGLFLELSPAYGGSLIHARAVRAGRGRAGRGTRSPSSAPSGCPACWRVPRSPSCSPRACSPAAPAAARIAIVRSGCARQTRSRCARSTSATPRSCWAPCCAPALVLAALRGRATLGGRPAGAGDGQQGVGGARRRPGAAGAAGGALARARDRGRDRRRVHAAAATWPRPRAPSRAPRRRPTRSSSRGRCGGGSAGPARSSAAATGW